MTDVASGRTRRAHRPASLPIRRLAPLPVTLVLAAALCTPSPPAAAPEERVPIVFAAASLTDVMREAAARFRDQGGGAVRFNLGASEALATQILAGAPADLFCSASANAMNRLQEAGKVAPGTRRDLLTNRLVVVAPADRAVPLHDLSALAAPAFHRIAMGDPAVVPAGRYANEALVRSGVWESIVDRVVPATDVRAALAYVSMGEADLGIVYATDARIDSRVRVVLEIPETLHSPILYPVALTTRGAFSDTARRFLEFLGSAEGLSILERAGFTPTPDARAVAAATGGHGEGAAAAAERVRHGPLLGPLLISLRVSLLSVLFGLPLALLCAYLLTRHRFPGAMVLETLLNLPLVLPPVATGYLLLILLSREGPLGPVWSRLGVSFVFTWVGAAVAAAVIAFPLMLRAAQVAYASIDPRLAAMARTLGASRTRAFLTVTLPLAFPGVLAATLLGFARSLGEFGATMMVAGSIPGVTQTLPLAIFNSVQVGADHQALLLCLLSALLAFASLAAIRLVEGLRPDGRAR
jgi:molybdate transport system permease protein